MHVPAGVAVALVACVAAQGDALDAAIDAALARARPALIEHLRLQHGGVLALVCLAAVHDGMSPTDPPFAAALDRLSRADLHTAYELALRLMVMGEVPAFPRREHLVGDDTARLLQLRRGGGFTYPKPSESWDLSNTQYAALGLRAAQALGATVPAKVWKEMAVTVLAAQAGDGGYAYTTGLRRHQPYASMTVAGIAVLELCRAALDKSAPAGIEATIARAWRWMERHAIEIGDAQARSCYYFHYGLERAAILSQVTRVGDVDWYRAGAQMLLAEQRREGTWRGLHEIRPGALPGEASPVDTAFAVLFLRRKFQRVVGPITGDAGLARLGANASDADIERTAAGLAQLGTRSIRMVLLALRSDDVPKRRAAVAALRQLAGTDFDIRPQQPVAASADAIKAAELWGLKALGQARAAPR